MTEEISNKTLAVIVIAAIVVTLGSTALILRMGITDCEIIKSNCVEGDYTYSIQSGEKIVGLQSDVKITCEDETSFSTIDGVTNVEGPGICIVQWTELECS